MGHILCVKRYLYSNPVTNMELRLPPQKKMKSIRAEVRKIARLGTTTACSLARLLGMMNATSCVIPLAPLFCLHLQMTLSNTLERNSRSALQSAGYPSPGLP